MLPSRDLVLNVVSRRAGIELGFLADQEALAQDLLGVGGFLLQLFQVLLIA